MPKPATLKGIQKTLDDFALGKIRVARGRISLPLESGGFGLFDLSKFLTAQQCTWVLYQIRRPLGLAFVISFVGWENCCRSIFRWTLICPSLSQSPDLLVFPATYTPPPFPPPHTLIVGPHLNLNHGRVSLTKLTCS
jgi:hypothetical protein